MVKKAVLALSVAVALAGCGGGGIAQTGGSASAGGGGGSSSAFDTSENAISTTNAIGGSLKAFSFFERSDINPASYATAAMPMTAGTCNNGTEIVTQSTTQTEVKYFYDSSCTYIARDRTRTWTKDVPSPGAETVQTSEKQYAFATANPPLIAVRDDSIVLSNTTFDSNGYPSRTKGYTRTSTGFLNIGSTKTIASNYEMIMEPASSQDPLTNSFCTDQAGYNVVGVGSLGNTFGWQGMILAGTRTVNSDGTVTWQGTHVGQTVWGPLGNVSIAVGTPNTSCTDFKPLYTISGGSSQGPHTVPFSATFNNGLLTALTITSAQLAGGYTLNVSTVPGMAPQTDLFISGTISDSSNNTVASFSLNAFGDGTLTMSSTGDQYTITDWHVRK